MFNRNWLWIIARLSVVLIVGLFVGIYYLSSGGGEKEFQKTLDAMKQLHSFRASYSGTPTIYMHNEMLWEVDCERGIVHHQQHVQPTSNEGQGSDQVQETNRDDVYVGDHEYERLNDGGWLLMKAAWRGGSAKWYCLNLAQGADTNLLPPIATMIKRGILQKGDKKTVNGVRCREWLVTMKRGPGNLEHDRVCLGLDDHLPYEVTSDWESAHYTFSDYNTAIQFDLPEAAVQPASAPTGSN